MKRTFLSFGVALWIAFTAPMAAAVPNRVDLIQLPPPGSATSSTYTGDTLNLNFQNIELRAALQQIADVAGLNLVAGDDVQGSLTLRLKDVPWTRRWTWCCKPKAWISGSRLAYCWWPRPRSWPPANC